MISVEQQAWRRCQHAIDQPHELRDRLHAQLVHHTRAVNLDRLLCGSDQRGDLLVEAPRGHERADFSLTRRKKVEASPYRREFFAGRALNAPPCNRAVDRLDEQRWFEWFLEEV